MLNAFEDRIIWSFWTGDNEMSEIRTDALGATVVIGQTALTSKDTTSTIQVVLNVDWSAAHADNEVRIDAVSIELV